MRAVTIGLVLTALLSAPAMACGVGGITRDDSPNHTPPVAFGAVGNDADVALSEADRATVKMLRATIDELVKASKHDEARKVEEEVMAVLGYRKLWTRCGVGSFIWMKMS